eukprot:CAMPEP_0183338312 /NCGR_PEP_ID=MMETSP0164_2-20130417/5652_1 /TAXON_ID=221442 /ORGANISM="Coccolithus pelagicus ssp braarudi, Strain PLY182g" /LENGTH=70 /DNA_ID=CAMNT_0025508141 /DNA_START=198 /DNA_END=406 /DNA_ORIENTATION=+
MRMLLRGVAHVPYLRLSVLLYVMVAALADTAPAAAAAHNTYERVADPAVYVRHTTLDGPVIIPSHAQHFT